MKHYHHEPIHIPTKGGDTPGASAIAITVWACFMALMIFWVGPALPR